MEHLKDTINEQFQELEELDRNTIRLKAEHLKVAEEL